jgi:hypothetical protein
MEAGTVEGERQRRRERPEEGRAREQDKRLVQIAETTILSVCNDGFGTVTTLGHKGRLHAPFASSTSASACASLVLKISIVKNGVPRAETLTV